MKKILPLLLLLTMAHQALAFRFLSGKDVIISRPVHEDLYVAGGNITINAPVYGDLIVAGGTVQLNDTIQNDLLLAGGTVRINGYVGDDIRCAGGELYVSQTVGGDLVITGGTVNIAKGSIVQGNLVASGGDVYVNGVAKQDVKAYAGNLYFNGIAEKGLEVRSGKAELNGTVMGAAFLGARNITIGRNAAFNSDVRYWTRKGTPDFGQSLKGSNATYDPSLKVESDQWYYLGLSTLLGLLWYTGMVFLVIALIQYLFGRVMRKAGNTFALSMPRSLGIGLLFLIGVPVAAAISVITLIGLPVGVFMLVGYVALILLATVIASVVAANWLNNRFHYHWTYWRLVFSAFAVFIVLKLVSFTPFFGWLIMLVIACAAFGSILQNINWRGRRQIAVS